MGFVVCNINLTGHGIRDPQGPGGFIRALSIPWPFFVYGGVK